MEALQASKTLEFDAILIRNQKESIRHKQVLMGIEGKNLDTLILAESKLSAFLAAILISKWGLLKLLSFKKPLKKCHNTAS